MSLLATRLLAFRADANLDKNEVRGTRNGAHELFKLQTQDAMGIISPELQQKALAAINTDLQVPLIDYKAATIQNVTQPLVVVDDRLTSTLYTVSWTDYYFGFKMYPAEFLNNEIGMQRYFNRQMERFERQLLVELDNKALATLELAKTQILADDLGGRYSLASNVVVAPNAEQDSIIGDINPLMEGNDFYGMLDVIANPSLQSHVRNRLLEKGQFNTENKTYQYNDKNWLFTNGLANAETHKATGIAVQKGTVGMLTQFGADNILGHTTSNHEWSINTLPISGLQMGTYFYDGAENGSALNGAASTHLTATKVESYGFHAKFAHITAYNSDIATRANPIMKFAIASA